MFSRIVVISLLAAGLAPELAAQDTPLADPTRPPLRRPGDAGGTGSDAVLRLEGIVISASRKLALIGGEFLREGERIYGLTVVRIDRDTVTMRRNGRTFVLRPESAVAESAVDSGETP